MCFAFGGALIAIHGAANDAGLKKLKTKNTGEHTGDWADAKILAWFWIGLGTLLQIIFFFDLTVRRLGGTVTNKVERDFNTC